MQDKTDETDTNDSEPKVKEEMQVDVDEQAILIGAKVEEINPLEIKKEPSESGETTDQSTPSTESKEKKVKEGENKDVKTPTLKRKRKPRKRHAKMQRMAEPQESQTESSNSVVEEEAPEPVVMETTVKIEPQVRVQEDLEYVLTVSNMPNTWTYMDIKNYIDTEIEPVDEMELVKDEKTGKGAIKLTYQSEEQCKSAMEKLQTKEIEGNKLTVEMTVAALGSDSDSNATDEVVKRPWRPDMDEWEIDPKGLYGLKQQFLKSLNIVPPIDKWVHVSNFRCDKSELRDIMELAGKVLSCSVFTVINKYAKVMYSHPLEAVQAVSMLNDAVYYGQKLNVIIDKSPSETVLLPKGLTSIGQGLGVQGKPLKNIVKHYKRLLANETSLLNPAVVDLPDGCVPKEMPKVHFQIQIMTTTTSTVLNKTKPVQTTANQNSTQNSQNVTAKPKNSPNTISTVSRPQIQSKVNNANCRPNQPYLRGPRPMGPSPMGSSPMGPNPMGPVRPMGPMGPGPMGPGPMGPGPMGPGTYGPRPMGPRMMGQYGNGWNVPGPARGPMQGPVGPGHMTPRPLIPGPMPVQNMGMLNSNEPVQLQLTNLPPSTTFAILCEKMAQCGQVVAIQLTTPGCAVVTFGNRMQADHCIKTYNGNYVDGHVIQVKYS